MRSACDANDAVARPEWLPQEEVSSGVRNLSANDAQTYPKSGGFSPFFVKKDRQILPSPIAVIPRSKYNEIVDRQRSLGLGAGARSGKIVRDALPAAPDLRSCR